MTSKTQIVLFKDILVASGDTTSTSISHTHRYESPVVHLSTIGTNLSPEPSTKKELNQTLVAVTQQGTIAGLHAETLKEKWTVGSATLLRSLPSSAASECQVDFVQVATAADVVDGIFVGKADIFSVYPQEIRRDGFNPEILILVVSVPRPGTLAPQRYLQILAFSPENGTQAGPQQGVLPVFSSPIPSPAEVNGPVPQYRLDVRSSSFQELQSGQLLSYTLVGGTARLENTFHAPGVSSFLRLSKSSILASTSTSLDVYNPLYRSLQATASVDPLTQSQDQSIPYKKTDECILVSYFATREIAVASRGSALLAIQVEPPKSRSSKRRAEGLLSDSIGRGLSRPKDEVRPAEGNQPSSTIFGQTLPGSVSETYWADLEKQVAQADELLKSDGMEALEILLAEKFGIELAEFKPTSTGDDKPLREWVWPSVRADYPRVDRRWVLYAISKVFSLEHKESVESKAAHLACQVTEGQSTQLPCRRRPLDHLEREVGLQRYYTER